MSSHTAAEPTYNQIVKELLGQLKDVMARLTSIPVIWPGQIASKAFPASQTYAVVGSTLSDESPISLGADPVYRANALVTLRFMATMQPEELVKIRNLANAIKEQWKSKIRTSDITIDAFSILDTQPEQGRMPVNLSLNYHFYT